MAAIFAAGKASDQGIRCRMPWKRHYRKSRVAIFGLLRQGAPMPAFMPCIRCCISIRRHSGPPAPGYAVLMRLLPDSIAVLWASQIPDDFHARYCATERCYLYLLLNHPVRPGLHHGNIGWFHETLDLESMRLAAQILVGEHDFSAFRAAECQAVSPVRHLTRLEISRQGDIILFELRANAFLHHMVRNIIGCLVYVGRANIPRNGLRRCWRDGNAGCCRTDIFPLPGYTWRGSATMPNGTCRALSIFRTEPAPAVVLPYFRGRTACG